MLHSTYIGQSVQIVLYLQVLLTIALVS